MNINVKPIITTAPDYHDFKHKCLETEELTGVKFEFFETEPLRETSDDYYQAIIWPLGAEDELFEFIFTNEEIWNILTNE